MTVTHTHFRLLARADQQAFLDLPWGLPLEEWPEELLVEAKAPVFWAISPRIPPSN